METFRSNKREDTFIKKKPKAGDAWERLQQRHTDIANQSTPGPVGRRKIKITFMGPPHKH